MSNKRASAGSEALTWPFIAALALLWVLCYSAGLWWVAQSAVQQQRRAQVEQAEQLADHLSSSTEPLLGAGELSAVRRLVSEAGLQQGLTECRLMLPDGRPLADADLDKPQLTVMPVTWPEQEASVSATRVINNSVRVERAVPVMGRGEATLTLSKPIAPAMGVIQPMLPGAGLVGVIGLAGALVVFRKMQGRLAVLVLIRGALRDAGDGAADLSSLSVNPAWGAEAKGWNNLIAAKVQQQDQAVEEQLEKLNARNDGGMLEDACEGLWSGLALTDGRGRVIYMNGAAAVSLQVDREQAMGGPLGPLLGDEQIASQFEQMLSGGGPGRVRHELTRGEGAEQNTIRVTLRRLGENGGVVATVEDITQQRVAEASRHDFVNRATHELRTPLTNIRLYVETAQTDGEEDKELRGECLNVISRESQRLERLVSEMLSVSEIEAGSLTIRNDDVRLDQLFKSLEKDYAANASQKDIELRFDLPPKLPAIQGDRDKLAIVLQNLLGNAIKYTPESGKVSVGVDLSSTELNIEVRDSGIGISEEDQAHVFEKFYRANDPRLGDITGSGLGLALAYEIVRLHGGEITVESELNEGSTFRVTLPISAEGL